MEDKQIVDLYWEKDENAIKQTQEKYGNYCFSIANNILHNNEDSQEVLNDTYMAAWEAMPPHRPLILSTFLGKITRRLSINKWRFNNAEKRGGGQIQLSFDELSECIADDRSIKEELDAKLLAESIDEFLSTLKENERKVFVCRYWYFDSVADIAKSFTYTHSKVKMMLKRTRDKLREHLEKEGIIV